MLDFDPNLRFSLFISRYDYFDGRFSKQIGDKLIIANLYCDFDALDNSQTSIVEPIDWLDFF